MRLVAEGDVVVCHNTWTGTYGGTAFRGVTTPQGKLFSVDHIHIYRLAEGMIAELWDVRDDRGRSAINRTPKAVRTQIKLGAPASSPSGLAP